MRLFMLIFLVASASANEQALQTLTQFHEALQKGNAETVLSLLANDAQIFESGYAESKSEYAAHHLAADIEYSKATRDKNLKQTQFCDQHLCVVQNQNETTGEFKQKTVHSIGMETAVLKKINDRWQIIHLHWSSRKAH